MKISTLVLVLLSLGTLVTLRAQNLPAGTAPDGGGGSPQPAPSPQRSIMPLAINHKPNPTAPPPEIAAAIDKFFKTLKAGDYVTAYDTYLTGTRLGAATAKKSFFISKTQDAFGIYGKLNDAEVFDNYSVGSNVIVLTYLSRHDLQPLRWRFIYYRPDKTWVLINMGLDDVLLDTLD